MLDCFKNISESQKAYSFWIVSTLKKKFILFCPPCQIQFQIFHLTAKLFGMTEIQKLCSVHSSFLTTLLPCFFLISSVKSLFLNFWSHLTIHSPALVKWKAHKIICHYFNILFRNEWTKPNKYLWATRKNAAQNREMWKCHKPFCGFCLIFRPSKSKQTKISLNAHKTKTKSTIPLRVVYDKYKMHTSLCQFKHFFSLSLCSKKSKIFGRREKSCFSVTVTSLSPLWIILYSCLVTFSTKKYRKIKLWLNWARTACIHQNTRSFLLTGKVYIRLSKKFTKEK